MRALILAAGLGTRMRPLSALRPKPVLPVRGIPLIAYGLALLARHGVTEVVVNLHHLPEQVREAAMRHRPPGLDVAFSWEPELLGTGGAIRRVAAFLRESDPSLVLGGDMLLDADLGALVDRHRTRGDEVTLLLRDDPRGETFGTIGVDAEGCVRRIGDRFRAPAAPPASGPSSEPASGPASGAMSGPPAPERSDEVRRGVYVHATVIRAAALESLPSRDRFGHLDAWLAPRLAAGARAIRGEVLPASACAWEPVGTPREYLAANLHPPELRFLDADARARSEGTRFDAERQLVIGAGAHIGRGARLERAVVWDGERVPPGLRARDGVFAGGRFHPCEAAAPRSPASPPGSDDASARRREAERSTECGPERGAGDA